MTNDRNYYRMLDDDGLINEGRDSMDELAIVLAERLATLTDAQEELEDAKKLIDELSHRCDTWMEQANELHAQLAAK